MNDIQRLYKVVSLMVNMKQQDYIYLNWPDCSLKEEFLTLMTLSTDVGSQQIQIGKFFMVLILISLHSFGSQDGTPSSSNQPFSTIPR